MHPMHAHGTSSLSRLQRNEVHSDTATLCNATFNFYLVLYSSWRNAFVLSQGRSSFLLRWPWRARKTIACGRLMANANNARTIGTCTMAPASRRARTISYPNVPILLNVGVVKLVEYATIKLILQSPHGEILNMVVVEYRTIMDMSMYLLLIEHLLR